MTSHRLSPAYRMIRAGILRARCVEPPALYDWASDPDLRDWSTEVRSADVLQRAGMYEIRTGLSNNSLPLPVPFRAYPGTSSEREP